MGLLTWIVVGIVVLAIIGLGWQTFFSGIIQGAKKIGDNPVIENVTNAAKDRLDDLTGDIVIIRPA
ncbi:hypothetical protein NTE_01539 [Candidatus Nitrososphaera evergladensis SR1]|jgi:hypothetical protein|uniref:Uncharacterized protein n=1 Tax=Candidatus Nitrososphaera evergladensis SR1 TaxID=1459636 RepID=A0A075MS12_9ARCH|nr:hypothetical protein NTE_01539 [Candidatus Nitrososphaera evergladensis SR1]